MRTHHRQFAKHVSAKPNSDKVTRKATLSKFLFSSTMSSSSVRVTNYPAIKNAPLVGLAEGNGAFNNLHLAGLLIVVPYILKSFLPIIKYGGTKTYLFMFILTAVPTAMGYWTFNSIFGGRKNEKVALPGKDIEEYITIKDSELKKLYKGKEKIPMQIFHDAYFEGKIDFKGMSFVLCVLVVWTLYSSKFRRRARHHGTTS